MKSKSVYYDGEKKRQRLTSPIGGLANLLDQAERLAKQWIDR
jgi:hypothetical protein